MVNKMPARFHLVLKTLVHEASSAASRPPATPKISCSGPSAIWKAVLPPPPVMDRLAKMVYSVMATRSSKLAAATTSAGMPVHADTATHSKWGSWAGT